MTTTHRNATDYARHAEPSAMAIVRTYPDAIGYSFQSILERSASAVITTADAEFIAYSRFSPRTQGWMVHDNR